MTKYHISAIVQGSKFIGEFEADSKEEAIKMAWEHENAEVNLCHQCSDDCEDANIAEMDVYEVPEEEKAEEE